MELQVQHREGDPYIDFDCIDIDDTSGFTYGMDVTIASDTCLHANSVGFNRQEVLHSNQLCMKNTFSRIRKLAGTKCMNKFFLSC